MNQPSITESYRAGYEAGYYYGRMAEMNGEAYDSRTPLDRKRAEESTTETQIERAE